MYFSAQYALLFVLAGFAAAAYFLRVGPGAKMVPIGGLAVCAFYALTSYGVSYAVLTVIEFAVGFGIAHAVVRVESAPKERDGGDNAPRA